MILLNRRGEEAKKRREDAGYVARAHFYYSLALMFNSVLFLNYLLEIYPQINHNDKANGLLKTFEINLLTMVSLINTIQTNFILSRAQLKPFVLMLFTTTLLLSGPSIKDSFVESVTGFLQNILYSISYCIWFSVLYVLLVVVDLNCKKEYF